jgi:hypothetical protein
MRWETVEQILKVVEAAAQSFKQGERIDRAYHRAVSRVSQEYGVAYQTIGDACRRRLGLDNVSDFKEMLRSALEGDPTDLQNLLLRKTSPSYHEKINSFFSNLKKGELVSKPRSSDAVVSYTIHLKKNDSDVLRALAELLGDKPEKILSEVAVDAIKERMKKIVNQF